jgi:hypothetical protein
MVPYEILKFPFVMALTAAGVPIKLVWSICKIIADASRTIYKNRVVRYAIVPALCLYAIICITSTKSKNSINDYVCSLFPTIWSYINGAAGTIYEFVKEQKVYSDYVVPTTNLMESYLTPLVTSIKDFLLAQAQKGIYEEFPICNK